MEGPKTRKPVTASPPGSQDFVSDDADDPNVKPKRRKRHSKPFRCKTILLKILYNRSFYRVVLVCANLIFIVSIVRSSRAATAFILRRPLWTRDVSFPPPRASTRIQPLDGKELMSRLGYPVRPQVLGVYSNAVDQVQVLPTYLQRRLTTNIVNLTQAAIAAQLHLNDSEDYEDGAADPLESHRCKAQFDWMKTSFPSCNHLHESDLTDLKAETRHNERVRLLGGGYWRDVWKVKNSVNEKVVLKTLRYQHDFEERNYDRHRRDAVAMERLTWSPNVIDIYASCGNSGIFQYAPGGDIEEVIWYNDAIRWNSTERLVVAYQVAISIADTHNSERNGLPAIAHTDISTSQFVNVDGRYRLNDFNRCRFITVHEQDESKACPFQVGNNPGLFRSPEEYAYGLESEKIDVYSMGNVFFVLLTNTWPFDGVQEKDARRMIREGQRPPIKNELRESKDPAHKALLQAMNMTWKQNPGERATAKEVADYFEVELKKIGVKGLD